jgi:hypothetical protein
MSLIARMRFVVFNPTCIQRAAHSDSQGDVPSNAPTLATIAISFQLSLGSVTTRFA